MTAADVRASLRTDKTRALALTPVSRETEARLQRFIDLLLTWQAKINLVAPSTLPQLWTRHVADSLQLLPLAPPEAKVWVDFGSGGGFPAIPVACVFAERPGAMIHLVESNGKKVAFLRETIRALNLPAKVHAERIEDFGDSFVDSADVVSARALAPLKTLCGQAVPLIARGAVGLFPKGQDIDAELTQAAKYWNIKAEKVPSKTSPEGCILVVRSLEPIGSYSASSP